MTESAHKTKNSYQASKMADKLAMYPLAVQALALAPHLTEKAATPEVLAELIDKTAEAIWMHAEPEF